MKLYRRETALAIHLCQPARDHVRGFESSLLKKLCVVVFGYVNHIEGL
jgi:hypothetical protein